MTNDIVRKLCEKHPNMTRLWDSNRPLNVKQREAVAGALQNKFQLVLGPPGLCLFTCACRHLLMLVRSNNYLFCKSEHTE